MSGEPMSGQPQPGDTSVTPEQTSPEHVSPKPRAQEPVSADDRATAYHEAGHAVVALSLGRTVEKVTIVRNSLRLGSVQFGSRRKGRRQDAFETEAMILLAGLLSEARVTGRMNWAGAGQDMLNLQRMICMRVGTDKAGERLQRRLMDKTEHWLEQPEIWSAVELIAQQLLQHGVLSGRAARHLYEQGAGRIA